MRQLLFFGSVLIFLLAGCSDKPRNDVSNTQNTSRKLDISAPMTFIVTNFGDNFSEAAKEYSLDVASADENGIVALVRGSERCEFEYELITVSRHGSHFDIGINSVPMTLEQVRKSSQATCKVVDIDDENLRNWFESKGFEKKPDPTCLQIGQVNNVHHSVTVRRSFNSGKPWRMLYELSFVEKGR